MIRPASRRRELHPYQSIDTSGSSVVHPLRSDCRAEYEKQMAVRPIVTVVDDDESVRESLPDLLVALGFDAKAFASAEEFLSSDAVLQTRCLILDVAMPGISGPELHRELLARGHAIATIFITAHIDETVRAGLLRQGAVACLYKPFSDKELRAALHSGLGEP
jgi:FixJ family two-component response regulator